MKIELTQKEKTQLKKYLKKVHEENEGKWKPKEERINNLEGITILFALFFRVIIGTLILDYLARFYPDSYLINTFYGMILIIIGVLSYAIMPLFFKLESINFIYGGKNARKKTIKRTNR